MAIEKSFITKSEASNLVKKALIEQDKFNGKKFTTKAESASTFHYKGSVQTYASLATITNPQAGDVYNIIEAGGTDDKGTAIKANDNVVRTDDGKWDVLAGTIDLSAYSTTSQIEQMIADSQADAFTDDEIKALVASANPGITLDDD